LFFRPFSRALLPALVALACLSPSRARAEPPAPRQALAPRAASTAAPALTGEPAWRPIHPAEYVAVGAALAGMAAFRWGVSPNENPATRAGELDEAARTGLRLSSERSRANARAASDVSFVVNIVYPTVGAPLLALARGRLSPRLLLRMTLIDAEVLAATGLLQTGVSALVGRERPFGRTCPSPADPRRPECADEDRYRSFFSGHTSFSFASAGLTCSHHLHLHLLGDAGDAAACATSLLAAAATGWLRIAGDRHYLSDVLTGAAVGSAVGFGLPWLLHYRGASAPSPADSRERPPALTWTLAPGPLGGALVGSF
jgi:membrane-associated phospholipid phosphatase